MLGFFKIKKLRTIIIIYWILLAYIIAALIYWFLLLNKQNDLLTSYRASQAMVNGHEAPAVLNKIAIEKSRKQIQYIAEGSTFLLLIVTGALFVFRAVRRQLKMSQLQHNFMMALTHELKTPIAVTKLNLETLKKRTLSPDIQQQLITNTLQEANRLNDLCSNMLLASQLEAGGYRFTYEENNLSEILSKSVVEYKNRFPERNFVINTAEHISLIADMLLIQMVINNLLDNAVKYSPPKSPVFITLDKDNKNIILKIADLGNGIPEEEKISIFRKFYRLGNQSTKEAKGTGLGLYLSKTIVHEMKGTIEVRNNLPAGSIFVITFPNHVFKKVV